jgi:hypothetical protein
MERARRRQRGGTGAASRPVSADKERMPWLAEIVNLYAGKCAPGHLRPRGCALGGGGGGGAAPMAEPPHKPSKMGSMACLFRT